MTRLLGAIGLVCFIGKVAWPATVRFDVVPVAPPTGNEVVVQPGQQVQYNIVCRVTSDTQAADNHGLTLFQVDLLTTSGITQPPVEAFDATITQSFTGFPSRGQSRDDDVIGIAAAQLGLGGPLVEGIAFETDQVIATGRLNTPATETSFTVQIASNAGASVAGAGSQQGKSVPASKVEVGPGFTVRTSLAAADGTGGTEQTGETTTPAPDPAQQAIAVAAFSVLGIAALFLLLGPIGLLIGLLLVPLLGILGMLNL